MVWRPNTNLGRFPSSGTPGEGREGAFSDVILRRDQGLTQQTPTLPSPGVPGEGKRWARGFSFLELLVVIGIIVILFSIFIPYVSKVRESEHRAQCAENLRTIMTALRTYAGAHHGDFPRVTYDPAHNPDGYVAYSGARAPDPFSLDTQVRPNDVTASLWLLVRSGLVKPASFICPSTDDAAEADAHPEKWKERSNFSSGLHLSYSYASPFSSAAGYKLNDYLPSDFALMADKNPGVSPSGSNVGGPAWDAPPFQMEQANSLNHRRVGQNVLYTDGHVQFQTTPYCGVGRDGERDNIYTALQRTPVPKGQNPPAHAKGVVGHDVGPAWERDSYLVPTEQD